MTQIRPISDLEDHLKDVLRLSSKAPVFLTGEDGNSYVFMTNKEYKKISGITTSEATRERVAKLRLMGWSTEEIAKSLRTTTDEVELLINELPKARK
jgi:hypothetical protein